MTPAELQEQIAKIIDPDAFKPNRPFRRFDAFDKAAEIMALVQPAPVQDDGWYTCDCWRRDGECPKHPVQADALADPTPAFKNIMGERPVDMERAPGEALYDFEGRQWDRDRNVFATGWRTAAALRLSSSHPEDAWTFAHRLNDASILAFEAQKATDPTLKRALLHGADAVRLSGSSTVYLSESSQVPLMVADTDREHLAKLCDDIARIFSNPDSISRWQGYAAALRSGSSQAPAPIPEGEERAAPADRDEKIRALEVLRGHHGRLWSVSTDERVRKAQETYMAALDDAIAALMFPRAPQADDAKRRSQNSPASEVKSDG